MDLPPDTLMGPCKNGNENNEINSEIKSSSFTKQNHCTYCLLLYIWRYTQLIRSVYNIL